MIPKFRAWYTPFGGSVKQFNKMKHGSAGSLLTHAEMSPDDYKIMQSTGLKDKNGVEIFEGDIITIIDNGEEDIGFGWNKVVIFHNGAFMVGDHNLLVNVNFHCVVINNIYEIK